MVGLATLVVMQTQGRSALGAWKLPDRFPDAFILKTGSGGLNADEVAKLRELPEVVPEDVMPIAITSPILGDNFLAIAKVSVMPTSTLFFGLDPEQANRMTELEFRRGDPVTATKMLKEGRHVLVTEEYRQIKNVDVGDTVELLTKTKGKVAFKIAGVVWSPGIDVMVSMFDLGGQFDQRTAYSVFGTLEDARELFGVRELSVFAVNLKAGVDREELNKKLEQDVGKLGLRAFDIRQVKAQIENGLSNLLLMASSVAFAALFVASLGVTNTIMASVRSRRWQFGVLRAVGLTRGQLMRLVLAESVLLAVAAVGLGLGAGAWMTHNARVATAMFIGFSPGLVIPVGMICIGVGTVLVVAVVAAWWPARGTSREAVLGLLQGGRASG
jgi:putative ABC transport system permease protein